MADINVVIIDPGGYRFDQLLDRYMAIRALVPLLVARLGLPDELKYQLIPRATGVPMQVTDTLASISAGEGSEIDLRPVRDDVFARLIAGLRKKAEGYVVDRLWALAKEQLDRLLRIDPENREAQQMQSQIAIHIDVIASTDPPIFPNAAPSVSATAPAQATPTVQASNAGCWVLVAIIAVGAIVWYNWSGKTDTNNQTKGSFTVRLVPSGNSYYFNVTAKGGERISVSVRGTDGFPSTAHGQVGDFEGSGSLSTPVIPRGKAGVVDTITVRSFTTGETQVFTFRFE